MSSNDLPVNGYQILHLIDEAKNLSYYRALREKDKKTVIIKVLKSDSLSPAEWIRFRREYEILSKLKNIEGVIKPYSLESHPKFLIMIVEDLGIRSLKSAMKSRNIPGFQFRSLNEFLNLAIRITQILADVHASGIIHKDINPYNIFYNPNTDQVRIAGFQYAAILSGEYPETLNTGNIEGSPEYISPEHTGRINRAIDFRSDLYSLGATFYDMLTGNPPFKGDDLLALIHAHIAMNPQDIRIKKPEVPAFLSDIVMKLLAKNLEDRYQSAYGLKTDLERCRSEYNSTYNDKSSLKRGPGLNDYSGQLRLSQKLYGLEFEAASLAEAFNRSVKGKKEVVFLTGPAGTGKTKLAMELKKTIAERHGYFITGKFDKDKQDIPYVGFIRAFCQLVDLLLIEPESKLSVWRNSILAAIDGNRKDLTEFIPEIEKIIGRQPDDTETDTHPHIDRFRIAVKKLIRITGTADHPLVIFLDDMQWADIASLELLKILMMDENPCHLLLIGACRTEELKQNFIYTVLLRELAESGAEVNSIILKNFQLESVRHFLKDAMQSSEIEIQELADLIYNRTEGNPLLIRQLLHKYYRDELLTFDYSARKWKWNYEKIKSEKHTDNFQDSAIDKIETYSGLTFKLLEIAACIGNTFNIYTLSSIGHISLAEAVNLLADPVRDHILVPLDDYYKFPETAPQSRFRFQRDNLQNTIYLKITDYSRQKTHLEIARHLLQELSSAGREKQLFNIVLHYNKAEQLITDTDERHRVAELNLQVADISYKSAAFHNSRMYLEKTLSYIPGDAWTLFYDFTLDIYSKLASVLSLTGDYEQLKKTVQTIETNAKSILDTAPAKHSVIYAECSRGELTTAIETGLTFIKNLGFIINRDISPEKSINYLRETSNWFTDEHIRTLYNLPDADAETSCIYTTCHMIRMPILTSDINLFFVFTSQIVRFIFKHGLAPKAPLLLASFAQAVGSALLDIHKARILTDSAVKLLESRYETENLTRYLSITIGVYLTHQYEHMKHSISILSEGMESRLTEGMFQSHGDCAWWHAWHLLFLGNPLNEVITDTQSAVRICRDLRVKRSINSSLAVNQIVLNLQAKSELPWTLKGDNYDEDEMLSEALRGKDFGEVLRIQFHKAWLHYLFRQPDTAGLFRKAEEYISSGTGMYIVPLFYFYDTLANTAYYIEKPENEQHLILDRINRNLKEFEIWVRNAPMNYQHKKDLMEAEKAKVEKKFNDAAILYEKAIRGAGANEFLNEEALALELAAEFFLLRGMEDIARLYITKAYDCYVRWQARAKISDIETKHGRLLDKSSIAVNRTSNDITEKNSSLDMQSVIKASQLISGTIIMEDLLDELMDIVIENAGAGRGCLLLKKHGKWFIEVESITEAHTKEYVKSAFMYQSSQEQQSEFNRKSVDINASDSIPLSVIRYAERNRTSIVIDNASENDIFSDDPYIKRTGAGSILCVPLINRGNMSGILYLENKLAHDTFTPERIEVLELLAGQAAIALENATLYQQAQIEITERRSAEAALRENEQRLKTIFDSVNDAIFIHDPDSGEIIDVNQKMCSMFGYTRDEALKIRAEEINSNEPNYTSEEGFGWIRKTVTEGPQLFEWRSRDKHGRIFWTEVNMRLASINGLDRILVVARDISDRKRFEEALEKRIVTLTRPLGSHEEIDLESLINVEDIQQLQDQFAEAFHVASVIIRPDGSLVTQPSNFTEFCSKVVRKTPDGIDKCNHFESNFKTKKPNVQIICQCLCAGLFTARINVTLGGHHIADLVVSQVRNIKTGNEEILKYAREIGADESEFLSAYIKIPSMTIEQFEKIAYTFSVMADRIFMSAYQNVLQARFIADLKRAEEELAKHRDNLEELVLERTKELRTAQEELLKKERLSVLGQLTATVSHELRNPLGVIRSSAFYLKEKIKNADEKISKHLNRIEYQIDLCDWIVEELLEYTRGSFTDLREENIISWLNSVMEDIQVPENILIIKDIQPNMPKLYFDRTKMSRVITNLITNAIHAVKEKTDKAETEKNIYKPEICISSKITKITDFPETILHTGHGVEIIVEDNGIGMDENTVRKSFDPLFTTKARGTGLGLSIVKKIIEEHSGTIMLESKLNEGTRVTIWLPDCHERK